MKLTFAASALITLIVAVFPPQLMVNKTLKSIWLLMVFIIHIISMMIFQVLNNVNNEEIKKPIRTQIDFYYQLRRKHCYIITQYSGVREKNWLALNQNTMSEWSHISLTFMPWYNHFNKKRRCKTILWAKTSNLKYGKK